MGEYLDNSIVRRPKTGFGAPVRKWINYELKDMVEDILSENNIHNRHIFNPAAVSELIKLNRSGKIDASYSIWSLLAIESWLMLFLDNYY